MSAIKSFVIAVLTAMVMMGCKEYVPVDTFIEAADPVSLTPEQEAAWAEVSGKLNVAWGSPDVQYTRSIVPEDVSNEPFRITAWKGERASAQIVMWSSKAIDGIECKVSDFTSSVGMMSASIAEARFVRYTLADEQNYNFKKGGPAVIAPDMLDSLSHFDMAACTTRPVWISLEIPRDVEAGKYSAEVVVYM